MSRYKSNKEYNKLLVANVIGKFGDSIDMIAFAWFVYTITGSASWSAVMVGVNQIVSVIFQAYAGAVVEYKNKKKVMVVSDLLRFAFIMILFLLYQLKTVNPYILIAFTICISFVETFRIPSGVSIIPMLLEEEQYDKAMSFNNSFAKCSELLGIVLAGVFLQYFNAIYAIVIDGFTFLFSAILISLIQYEDTSVCLQAEQKRNTAKVLDACKFLASKRKLFIICIVCGLINAVVIPFESLQADFTKVCLNGNVQVLSIMNAMMSIGMIAGSLFYSKIAKRIKGEQILLSGGMMIGMYYIGISAVLHCTTKACMKHILYFLCAFAMGIFIALMNNYVQIFFVSEVKQEYLTRISAIATTITTIGSPVAAFIVAILARQFSTISIFILTGILAMILFEWIHILLKGENKKE